MRLHLCSMFAHWGQSRKNKLYTSSPVHIHVQTCSLLSLGSHPHSFDSKSHGKCFLSYSWSELLAYLLPNPVTVCHSPCWRYWGNLVDCTGTQSLSSHRQEDSKFLKAPARHILCQPGQDRLCYLVSMLWTGTIRHRVCNSTPVQHRWMGLDYFQPCGQELLTCLQLLP